MRIIGFLYNFVEFIIADERIFFAFLELIFAEKGKIAKINSAKISIATFSPRKNLC